LSRIESDCDSGGGERQSARIQANILKCFPTFSPFDRYAGCPVLSVLLWGKTGNAFVRHTKSQLRRFVAAPSRERDQPSSHLPIGQKAHIGAGAPPNKGFSETETRLAAAFFCRSSGQFKL